MQWAVVEAEEQTDEPTRVYLRDVYDHAIRIIDTVEVLRDVIGGIIDLYLSSLSNRTNEVMKALQDTGYANAVIGQRRVVEPGKIAGWVAPPARGIHGKPVDYEYVKFH